MPSESRMQNTSSEMHGTELESGVTSVVRSLGAVELHPLGGSSRRGWLTAQVSPRLVAWEQLDHDGIHYVR